MWRRCRRTNVRSLGGSTPKKRRKWDFKDFNTKTCNSLFSWYNIDIDYLILQTIWTISALTACFLSSLDNSTCLFLIFSLFNHKIVTLQQTFSYLRAICSSSVSPSWVYASLSTTVKLLWLDAALSYSLHNSSLASVPINSSGIILHISTYCGQGCGNKHLKWYCPRRSACEARPKRWKKAWEDGGGENIHGNRTNYKVCQVKNTRGVKNGLQNNLVEGEQRLEWQWTVLNLYIGWWLVYLRMSECLFVLKGVCFEVNERTTVLSW